MIVWRTVLAGAVLLGTAVAPASAGTAGPAPDVPADASPDGWVAERSEALGVPGVAWAVVGPDGVEDAGSHGVDGEGRPVTAETPFLWGSVSKPVTATLVALLEEEGRLAADDTVAERLPALADTDLPVGDATVRQLLTHTAGLPAGLQLLDDAREGRGPEDVVDRLGSVDPVATPGAEHHYSGLGYVVLAAVVEEVTGQGLAEALASRGLPSSPGDSLVGYRYVAGRAVARRTEVDDATLAAGYLGGSLLELAAFARTQLTGGPVLTDAQRDALHAPAVPTGPGADYGLGWRVSTPPGAEAAAVWHGGAAPGYAATVVLVDDGERAVVVLQNAYGPFHDEALMAVAGGLATLVEGGEPVAVGPGAAYPALLSLLAAAVLVVAGMLVLLARGRRRASVAVPVVVGVLATALGLALLALPGLLGVRLAQLPLWAPDVAGLVYAGLALGSVTVVVALLMATTAVRRRRA